MERRPFAPLTTVATAAKLLLAVVLVVDLAAALSSFRLVQLAVDAEQLGHSMLYHGLEAPESTHALVRTLQLGSYAVATLALVLWFRRAYSNLRAVDPDREPLPRFVSPTRLVRELWRESDSERTARIFGRYGAWWRTFAIGALLVVAGSLFWSSWVYGEAVVQLEVSAIAQLVGNLLGVASAVLTYVVVDRTSKRQHASAAKLALWRTAPEQ